MERLFSEVRRITRVKVFSGDTAENFMRCGMVDSRGRVFYDKTRHEQAYRETYASKGNAEVPVIRAIEKGLELGHHPLVMEGSLSRFSEYYRDSVIDDDDFCILPIGEALPVASVWLARDTESWKGVSLGQITHQTLRDYFTKTDPRLLLASLGRI